MNAVSTQVSLQNRLLSALQHIEYERLLRGLTPVHLPRGRIVCEVGDLPDEVYFPLSGVISLLSSTEAGEVVEVAMVGKEGTTAIPGVAHAQEMPYRALVQVPVEALSIKARIVREEFMRGGQLHNLLICYTHSLFAQIARSAVCNRFHTAEQRLCRWLLCTHDRVQSDTVDLTHEIISYMLGTQRSVVSVAAGNLQKMRLINYNRGSIQILDRRGLEGSSCECYRLVEQQVAHCLVA